MSDLPPPDVPRADADEAPDMTAAELALGLIEGEERAGAIRRVLAEPGFAHAVERWRTQLAQLFDLWPEMPAPDVLARVERSIDRPPHAAPVVAPLPVRTPSRLWPALAGLSSIAAAGLLVVLFTRPVPLPPAPQPRPAPVAAALPTLVASLAPTGKGAPTGKDAPVTAVYDARAGAIRLTEAKLAGGDRAAELWVIPSGGTPHSLGLLSPRGGTALALTADNRARIAAGATLAVTLEPIGGSPTGLPTGPVVAAGALSAV